MNERDKKLLGWSGLQPFYPAQERQIERFADYIRAHEREACAKLCKENFYAVPVRVKSEPKPDVVWYAHIHSHGYCIPGITHFPDANLKLTFDGETGKLKSAEVLK